MDDVNIHIDELVIDQRDEMGDRRVSDQVHDQLGGLLPLQHIALMSGAVAGAVADAIQDTQVRVDP